MTGLIGKFISEIPLVVIIALSASLVEAFIILPAHLSDFMRKNKPIASDSPRYKKQTFWFKKLQNFYVKILGRALRNRYKVFLGIISAFIISCSLK